MSNELASVVAKLKHRQLEGVAARLREIRGNATANDIAKRCKITGAGWAKMEAAVSWPGGAVLQKLAEMGYSVDWILTGEGMKERMDDKAWSEVLADTIKQIEHHRKVKGIEEPVSLFFNKALLSAIQKHSRSGITEYLAFLKL